jgi:hypothetical protein
MSYNNIFSVNCQVCGIEHKNTELSTIKLAGFNQAFLICEACLSKTVEGSFKDAADILNDIVKIAKSADNAEKRLAMIRSLISE